MKKFLGWIKSWFANLSIGREIVPGHAVKTVLVNGKEVKHHWSPDGASDVTMVTSVNMDDMVVDNIQTAIYEDTGIWFSKARIKRTLDLCSG